MMSKNIRDLLFLLVAGVVVYFAYKEYKGNSA